MDEIKRKKERNKENGRKKETKRNKRNRKRVQSTLTRHRSRTCKRVFHRLCLNRYKHYSLTCTLNTPLSYSIQQYCFTGPAVRWMVCFHYHFIHSISENNHCLVGLRCKRVAHKFGVLLTIYDTKRQNSIPIRRKNKSKTKHN